MANEVFKPIEEFVLTSPTGSEQVQVSATQKVTLSQIAQLVKSAPLLSSEVTVTNFGTHSYTGRYSFSAIPDNSAFSFKAAESATNGPGVAVYGLAIKISSDTAIYFAGDSSGAQYCIYGVSGAGTNVTNSLYGEGLTKVDVTDFKALTTLLSSIPSGTVVAYRAANTVANGPLSGAGSWGFIFKIDNSTYRVIANIFGGTAAGWGYDMYVGSISGTTTAYWSKINGASEIPDNVRYLSQVYVSDDLSTLWSELESMTNSSSVSAGDFFPFRFNADAAHAPTANAGHGFYQYGTNCAYAIIFEEVATGNGRAWFGHFESSGGEAVWTEIGSGGGDSNLIHEITDFAIPSLNITKDGESFFIYANDASNNPNNNDGSTSFVGIAVASPIFILGDQRLLYYMIQDTQKSRLYTGYANLEDDTVTWSDGVLTRLSGAPKVTAFTESSLSTPLYSWKTGDFIPFYTDNTIATSTNQFPESGAFNGFISMGSNEGDYFQIFAFKTGGGGKAYLGSCIGNQTQWAEIGAASSGGVFGGFHNIMANNYKYVETLNQYDFSILLNKPYNFNTELEDKKLYLDMELVSGTPYYHTAAPLPIEIVTIQNHWLTDNVVVYSALLNTPTNGKIKLILTAPSNPSVISTLNFTVIGSSLSGALKINGIYIK